jgi:hypothetical protein
MSTASIVWREDAKMNMAGINEKIFATKTRPLKYNLYGECFVKVHCLLMKLYAHSTTSTHSCEKCLRLHVQLHVTSPGATLWRQKTKTLQLNHSMLLSSTMIVSLGESTDPINYRPHKSLIQTTVINDRHRYLAGRGLNYIGQQTRAITRQMVRCCVRWLRWRIATCFRSDMTMR